VSLELLYYDPIASKEIRGLDAAWKMEWRDFLDASVGRWGACMMMLFWDCHVGRLAAS
jgi:prepilin-type processing-associated H-X9-DG protein